jgi:hypothetical protein
LRVEVENETTARGVACWWMPGRENLFGVGWLHRFHPVENSTADR